MKFVPFVNGIMWYNVHIIDSTDVHMYMYEAVLCICTCVVVICMHVQLVCTCMLFVAAAQL